MLCLHACPPNNQTQAWYTQHNFDAYAPLTSLPEVLRGYLQVSLPHVYVHTFSALFGVGLSIRFLAMNGNTYHVARCPVDEDSTYRTTRVRESYHTVTLPLLQG